MMVNAASVGEYALRRLKALMEQYDCIGEVRGKGLMIGIEFVKDRQSKEADVVLRDRVADEAFQRGLLTLGCGKSTIRIAPPLCLTRSEANEALEIFESAISLSEAKEQLVAA